MRAAAAPWQHVRLVGEDIVATEPLLPRGHRIRPFDIGALLAAGPRHRSGRAAAARRHHPHRQRADRARRRAPPPGADHRVQLAHHRRLRQRMGRHAAAPAARAPTIASGISAAVRRARRGARRRRGDRRLLGGRARLHGRRPARSSARCSCTASTSCRASRRSARASTAHPVLGVPGYPVSAVDRLPAGAAPVARQAPRHRAASRRRPCAPLVPRKLPSRLGLEEFVRVTLGRVGERLVANPLARGAGVISTMVRADGVLRIPPLAEGINAGEEVEVELLRPAREIDNTIVFSGSHDLADRHPRGLPQAARTAAEDLRQQRRQPRRPAGAQARRGARRRHAPARPEDRHLQPARHRRHPRSGATSSSSIWRCASRA